MSYSYVTKMFIYIHNVTIFPTFIKLVSSPSYCT